MTRIRNQLSLLALLLCVACEEDPDGCPLKTRWLAPPEISTVPTILDGCLGRYRLDATLWRDFMPITPKDGPPLSAIVTLIELDSRAIEPDVEPQNLWVVTPEGTWSTRFNPPSEEGLAPNRLRRRALCGPKWNEGTLATVIVAVRCGRSDPQVHYVKKEGILIEYTY